MTLHASPSAETIAAHRREVEKLAAAGDPLAIATLDGWARTAAAEPTSGMASVASFIPKAAGIAIGAFKRALPKLWAIESDRFDPRRKFDLEAWRLAFRRSRENRVPAAIYGKAVVEVLYDHAQTGTGLAVVTMARIAEVANCCIDTVRKVIRQGEADGFIDSWNRTERPTKGPLKGFVIRAANAYVPIMPEHDYADAVAAAEGSAEAVLPDDGTVSRAQAWLGRVARQIKRGEQLFRLAGRKLGLNLTPLRTAPA